MDVDPSHQVVVEEGEPHPDVGHSGVPSAVPTMEVVPSRLVVVEEGDHLPAGHSGVPGETPVDHTSSIPATHVQDAHAAEGDHPHDQERGEGHREQELVW